MIHVEVFPEPQALLGTRSWSDLPWTHGWNMLKL